MTLCRKPLPTSVARNVVAYGVGGLNIEATRLGWVGGAPSQDEWNRAGSSGVAGAHGFAGQFNEGLKQAYRDGLVAVPTGRWPANVVFQVGSAVTDLDAQRGISTSGTAKAKTPGADYRSSTSTSFSMQPGSGHGDTGGASRFFKLVGRP